MPVHNTNDSYGSVHKFLHWVIGVLIIALLGVGLWMTGLVSGPFRYQIYGLHKSFGVVVLVLAFMRVWWRMREVLPSLSDKMPSWQKKAAEYVHTLLYGIMFIMPLSGWAMSNAAGYKVTIFGTLTLPNIIWGDPELSLFFRNVHEVCAYIAIAIISAHVGAALLHHVIEKDNTLTRMLPGRDRRKV